MQVWRRCTCAGKSPHEAGCQEDVMKKSMQVSPGVLYALPEGHRKLYLFQGALFVGRYQRDGFEYWEKFLLAPVEDAIIPDDLKGVVIDAVESPSIT
jgi:hypothetical protein